MMLRTLLESIAVWIIVGGLLGWILAKADIEL